MNITCRRVNPKPLGPSAQNMEQKPPWCEGTLERYREQMRVSTGLQAHRLCFSSWMRVVSFGLGLLPFPLFFIPTFNPVSCFSCYFLDFDSCSFAPVSCPDTQLLGPEAGLSQYITGYTGYISSAGDWPGWGTESEQGGVNCSGISFFK